ncbi:MAG: hypothetical protein GY811_16920, partial [Myxococcales bacterium]|nr:hypothetical protein [Myxococcales bacterium]
VLPATGAGCTDPGEREADWDFIHAAIIEPSCATVSCHSSLSKTAGIDLEDVDQAYDLLTEQLFVVPFAYISDPVLGPETPTFGATAMHEKRGDAHALGAGARLRYNKNNTHAWVGGHYKHWFESKKLMLMAELNAGYQSFQGSPDNSRLQLLGYVGPVWFPMKGLSASLAYEHFDEDLLARYVERHAVTSTVSFLPAAHYEVILMGRAERIGPPGRSYTGMLQFHYYL